jgi:hypothetical protein
MGERGSTARGLLHRDSFHLPEEPVSPARHGLDIGGSVAVWRIAQRFPQGVATLRKVTLLDSRPGPELLHQVIFFQEMAGVLHQQEQCIEGLGSKADRLIATGQPSLSGIQKVRAEPEKLFHVIPCRDTAAPCPFEQNLREI